MEEMLDNHKPRLSVWEETNAKKEILGAGVMAQRVEALGAKAKARAHSRKPTWNKLLKLSSGLNKHKIK